MFHTQFKMISVFLCSNFQFNFNNSLTFTLFFVSYQKSVPICWEQFKIAYSDLSERIADFCKKSINIVRTLINYFRYVSKFINKGRKAFEEKRYPTPDIQQKSFYK